jgi:hypothetical protein
VNGTDHASLHIMQEHRHTVRDQHGECQPDGATDDGVGLGHVARPRSGDLHDVRPVNLVHEDQAVEG